MKFYIVDAFTDSLFGGNPAGVVILDKGADFPDDETMRKAAEELRYSETAFIKPIGDGQFNIRYFTPAAEVDLCGHATIGSFYALADAGIVEYGSSCSCKTLAGLINIEVSKNSVLMDMGAPSAIQKIEDEEKLKELYCIMGLDYKGQGEVSTYEGSLSELRPEIVSTGLPDIMMPVKSLEELNKIKPDFAALSKLSEKYNVTGVHAFTVNTDDGAVHCRNFAPLYEIDEEAATGTANGALTYYLYRNGLIDTGSENLFIQGEAMKRPSKIMSKLSGAEGALKIQIGGSGAILACGEIRI